MRHWVCTLSLLRNLLQIEALRVLCNVINWCYWLYCTFIELENALSSKSIWITLRKNLSLVHSVLLSKNLVINKLEIQIWQEGYVFLINSSFHILGSYDLDGAIVLCECCLRLNDLDLGKCTVVIVNIHRGDRNPCIFLMGIISSAGNEYFHH